MSGLVDGKVALVTGAGAGIGRASALCFAREGARVVVSDVDEAAARDTAEAIGKAGGEALAVVCDVADDAAVAAMVRAAVERFGRLDCAHNNAGISGDGAPTHRIPPEEWRRVLAVNLDGVFHCMRHEIPALLEAGGGAIVNSASGAGLVPSPTLAHYCASKHGVLGLTKTAAQEYARAGIRVNALCPGPVDTPMLRASMERSPVIEQAIRASAIRGTLGRPEEVAEAAVWLCSDRASLVSGAALPIDGGGMGR